jgi:hypothetical protein
MEHHEMFWNLPVAQIVVCAVSSAVMLFRTQRASGRRDDPTRIWIRSDHGTERA